MILAQLSESQIYRLTSLPYRVGLYISESDQSGGDAANENEIRALENIIYGFADGMFGVELIQDIMARTVQQKDEWSKWQGDLDKVPEECRDALSILSAYVNVKMRQSFAQRLIDIGEAVALAFREDISSQSGFSRLKARFRYWGMVREAKSKKLPVRSFDAFLSISAPEREALLKVARAMNVTYV